MPYPPRPQLRPLAPFVGTASPRPDSAVQERVEAFIVEQYAAGRSLRELSELTDRSSARCATSSTSTGYAAAGPVPTPCASRDLTAKTRRPHLPGPLLRERSRRSRPAASSS